LDPLAVEPQPHLPPLAMSTLLGLSALLSVSALLAPLHRGVQLHPRLTGRAPAAVATATQPDVDSDVVTFGIRRVPMVHEHELDSLLPFGLSFGPADGKGRLPVLRVLGYNITTPSYNELLFVYALLPPILAFAFYPQVPTRLLASPRSTSLHIRLRCPDSPPPIIRRSPRRCATSWRSTRAAWA
jgi:hypothetical protein